MRSWWLAEVIDELHVDLLSDSARIDKVSWMNCNISILIICWFQQQIFLSSIIINDRDSRPRRCFNMEIRERNPSTSGLSPTSIPKSIISSFLLFPSYRQIPSRHAIFRILNLKSFVEPADHYRPLPVNLPYKVWLEAVRPLKKDNMVFCPEFSVFKPTGFHR